MKNVDFKRQTSKNFVVQISFSQAFFACILKAPSPWPNLGKRKKNRDSICTKTPPTTACFMGLLARFPYTDLPSTFLAPGRPLMGMDLFRLQGGHLSGSPKKHKRGCLVTNQNKEDFWFFFSKKKQRTTKEPLDFFTFLIFLPQESSDLLGVQIATTSKQRAEHFQYQVALASIAALCRSVIWRAPLMWSSRASWVTPTGDPWGPDFPFGSLFWKKLDSIVLNHFGSIEIPQQGPQ